MNKKDIIFGFNGIDFFVGKYVTRILFDGINLHIERVFEKRIIA